jgi:tetratricopeptide (TPR) repeat protein
MPIQIADAYRHSAFAQRQTGLLFNLPMPDPDFEQLPEGISLCMIVKNEERFLAECLESVKDVVDEICIVDTGSTDRTVAIAQSYGARIEYREWRNDFAWARNEALAMAKYRWTLILDADEELERESIGLMKSLRSQPAQAACVYINIVNLIDDASGAGTMSHRLIRIMPTNPILRYSGVIHESIMNTEATLDAVLSPITILHKGYTVEMLNAREKDARNKPLLARAYEENGDDPFALFNFGNSAICSGNHELGIEVLERMLKMDVGEKIYFPLAYLMLGQTYAESMGDLDRALEILEEACKRYPRDAGLKFTRGQVLVKMGDIDAGRKLFEEALDMRDLMAAAIMTDEEVFEWKIFYSMAGTYEREGDYDKAVEFIDKALANKPTSFHLLRAKAAYLEKIERYYDAEVVFRRLAEVDPERGQVEVVNYLLRRKRFAQAIAIVESQSFTASNAEVLATLKVAAARVLIESKQGDPMPYLESALRAAPGNGLVISVMEAVLTERGETEALEKLHREELEAPLTRPADFVRRTYRLLAIGRNDDAYLTAERGLSGDPENAELRFNAAIALLRTGEEARAGSELARIGRHAPEVYSEALRMRAALALKYGKVAEGAGLLRERAAMYAEPANAVLEGARLLAGSNGLNEAMKLLEDHLGRDSRIALELAGLMMQSGDVAGAGRIAAAALA